MRHFGIVFDGGFALANEEWQIANVASRHSNVEIVEYHTREQAYFYTAYKLIKREYWRAPYRQLPLPKIEDMCNANWVFYSPDYVGNFNPPIRFFAAFSKEYVGILDNVEALIGFLAQVPFLEIKECNNIIEAQNYINFSFLKFILPFSAYIPTEIHRYSTIPLNTLVPSIFKNWQDMVRLPDGISPQIYLPAPNMHESVKVSAEKTNSQC
ncbi:MAG: hypothetical protein J5497_08735 [Selenomonadaceae bacterium]|nr:hypothetical protein [Selenomonadaceae bacterium]